MWRMVWNDECLFWLISYCCRVTLFFFSSGNDDKWRSCIISYIGLIDIGCFVDNLLSYSKTCYCDRGNNNKHTVEVSVYLWWCRWKLKHSMPLSTSKKSGLSEVIKGNPMKPADAKQYNGMKQVFFVIDPLSIQCYWYILSYPYHLQSH